MTYAQPVSHEGPSDAVVEMGTAISTEIVSLMKEYLGRGPTRVRTYVYDKVVVCIARDTMTKAERTLVETRNHHLVRDLRRSLTDSFADDAVAIVERVTGQAVMSFMSDHDTDTDTVADVFVLAHGDLPGV